MKASLLVLRAQGWSGASPREDVFPLYFPKAGRPGVNVEKLGIHPGGLLGWLVIFNLIELSIGRPLAAPPPLARAEAGASAGEAAKTHLIPQIPNNENNDITAREKWKRGRGGESTTTPWFASLGLPFPCLLFCVAFPNQSGGEKEIVV